MSSHGGGGGERWLVSYSDFITLLMVLFVVLYSMGQTDVKRYKALAGSLKAAFSGGPNRIVDPGITQSGGSEDKASAPIVIPGIPQVPVDSSEVAGELTDMLATSNMGGAVSVQNNIEGILISLSEKLTFHEGTAELQKDAYPVLDTIIKMVTPLENEIRVIGHTNNTPPPAGSKYASNWELSSARALVIGEYLIKAGINPERITVSGRGETKPLFPNDTPEHRTLNGRADIVIIYSVNSDVVNSQMLSPVNVSPGVNNNPAGMAP